MPALSGGGGQAASAPAGRGAPGLRDLRQLAATVAAAEDAALLRLVRLLDGLPNRGEADRVLEPARPRLRRLRPRRPLRFARLLFTPLDGAIVAAAEWRRGGHEVPRSAIGPLAVAVQERLRGTDAEIGPEELDGLTTDDADALARFGARLWPAAAAALPERPPAGWAAAGLAAEDYAPIRAVLAPVLDAGRAIHAALRAAAQGPPQRLVRAALAGPAAAGPQALAATLATLLPRAGAPAAVLAVAAEFGNTARGTANTLLDAALEQVPDLGLDDPQAGAEGVARFLGWTEDLVRNGGLDPDRLRRVLALQRDACEGCRRRITEVGAGELVAPLGALCRAEGPVADEAVAQVEAQARALRTLASVARGVGDPAAFDRTLRALADQVMAMRAAAARPDATIGLVDLARVVEILAGPEVAAGMLRGAPPPGTRAA